MPFKIRNSPNYHVELRSLPGYGDFPRTSTHVTSKSIARQMEHLLRRIAERGLEDPTWYQLLDALRAGGRGQVPELTLPELLRYHNEGRLGELKISLKDPLLSEAIEEYSRTGLDYETKNGLAILEEMVRREYGARCRLSVLRSGKNVTVLCARAEREGGRSRSTKKWDNSRLSRNTVYRGMRNASSKLCTFHFGASERDRIFADVQYSSVEDGRDVFLNARQLEKLLRSCESWFRPFVLAAALTGADRAPLLRLTAGDVDVVHRVDLGLRVATLYVRDRKNDARPRTVTLAGPPADAIAELVDGRATDEKVFRGKFDAHGRRQKLTPDRVRRAWEKAREKAAFTKAKGWHADLRFKDLRHTAGVAFEKAGLSITEIGAGLGHKRRETSLRYTARQISLSAEDAIKVAQQLGILHIVPKKETKDG